MKVGQTVVGESGAARAPKPCALDKVVEYSCALALSDAN